MPDKASRVDTSKRAERLINLVLIVASKRLFSDNIANLLTILGPITDYFTSPRQG